MSKMELHKNLWAMDKHRKTDEHIKTTWKWYLNQFKQSDQCKF